MIKKLFCIVFILSSLPVSLLSGHKVQHLGLIMDGNRRWAKKYKLQLSKGYNQGIESVRMLFRFCIEHDIPYVSIYTLSIENIQRRPAHELNSIYNLFLSTFKSGDLLKTFKENKVRVVFIGDKTLLPEKIIDLIEYIESETADNNQLQVNVLLGYGGRQEIIAAVKNCIEKAAQGIITAEDCSESFFQEQLWMSSMPDLDLIIRTGGARRLSNFLLYQSAYAELYFLDILWPDLTYEHLEEALTWYNRTAKNFGS